MTPERKHPYQPPLQSLPGLTTHPQSGGSYKTTDFRTESHTERPPPASGVAWDRRDLSDQGFSSYTEEVILVYAKDS